MCFDVHAFVRAKKHCVQATSILHRSPTARSRRRQAAPAVVANSAILASAPSGAFLLGFKQLVERCSRGRAFKGRQTGGVSSEGVSSEGDAAAEQREQRRLGQHSSDQQLGLERRVGRARSLSEKCWQLASSAFFMAWLLHLPPLIDLEQSWALPGRRRLQPGRETSRRRCSCSRRCLGGVARLPAGLTAGGCAAYGARAPWVDRPARAWRAASGSHVLPLSSCRSNFMLLCRRLCLACCTLFPRRSLARAGAGYWSPW